MADARIDGVRARLAEAGWDEARLAGPDGQEVTPGMLDALVDAWVDLADGQGMSSGAEALRDVYSGSCVARDGDGWVALDNRQGCECLVEPFPDEASARTWALGGMTPEEAAEPWRHVEAPDPRAGDVILGCRGGAALWVEGGTGPELDRFVVANNLSADAGSFGSLERLGDRPQVVRRYSDVVEAAAAFETLSRGWVRIPVTADVLTSALDEAEAGLVSSGELGGPLTDAERGDALLGLADCDMLNDSSFRDVARDLADANLREILRGVQAARGRGTLENAGYDDREER